MVEGTRINSFRNEKFSIRWFSNLLILLYPSGRDIIKGFNWLLGGRRGAFSKRGPFGELI